VHTLRETHHTQNVGDNQKKEKMDLIKKWFENFKASNKEKEKFISQIEDNISATGYENRWHPLSKMLSAAALATNGFEVTP